MSTIPSINEQDIRDYIGERSFNLGQAYFRGDTIFDVRRQGMTLKARCQGSRPDAYRVEVTFVAAGISNASCSCPVGGHCKHVAALLLTWLKRPKDFLEQEEVDTVLGRCTKTELISLIKKMLQQEPDLEMLLPIKGKQHGAKAVNPEVYRRRVQSAFRSGGSGWGAAMAVSGKLYDVKETADGFFEKEDYASAVAVYGAIVMGVIEDYERYDDEEGEIGSVINDCVSELDACLAAVHDDPALRKQMMEIVFEAYGFDVKAGGIGVGEEAPDILLKHATAEERQMLVGWVREKISELKNDSTGWARGHYSGFLEKLASAGL